ncbi:uncharacterized protein LOC141866873 isoform X3 [Acropora palmata]|uniref:uncharacterized protein LOC141866873 isoform X3 n=1 Tax=Acropora palmata TaxID=6131 RepID=UPI003DA0A8BA
MIITLIKCRCIEDQEGDENKESYQLTYFLKLFHKYSPWNEIALSQSKYTLHCNQDI